MTNFAPILFIISLFHHEDEFSENKVNFLLVRGNHFSVFHLFASLMTYLVNITKQYLNAQFLLGLNILVFINLILLYRDIKKNRGFKAKSNTNLPLCHWNVK